MEIRTLGTVILLLLLLFTAFLIRIQGLNNIPEGQFTGRDAYLYYWQAQLISEHGHLPERDMHRWLPLGRDLGQTLNLYSYALAYAHKAVALLFPKVSLYHVALYAPVVCFCIGLGALCLFLSHSYGLLFSGITGVFLATLPGAIERSTAGFSDRDSWCLMLGILAIVTYLASLQARHHRPRLLWTLGSGISVFLGGISWEGFGVFLSIILVVEVWRFLTTETEECFHLYLLWVCCFVPTLYLASPAYRSGYGFAEHLTAFLLVPPVVILILRASRNFFLTKTRWADRLKTHARTLSLGLTLASIMLAIGYALTQMDTFAGTTVPLNQNRLMQNIGELKNPLLEHWMVRYGSVFVLGCLGLVMAVIRFWKREGLLFTGAFILFTLTTFYRSRMDGLLGTATVTLLFAIAIAACGVGLIALAGRRHVASENEPVYIAFIIWLIFWVALSRDARRYDFFIGTALAFFTADIIGFLSDFYGNKIKEKLLQYLLKTAILGITLTLILFWSPAGGHAKLTLSAATQMRRAIPGRSKLAKPLSWMKDNLPPTAVVAGTWNYGSLLNVLGGVKTVIDQDHYIQHWIHLYNRHVHCATTTREALEFLKTHEVTHLMLDAQDAIFNAAYYSNLGSDENGDLRFTITPLQEQTPKDMKYRAAPGNRANILVEFIDFDFVSETLLTVRATLKTGDTVNLPAVALINKGYVTAKNKNEHGGVLIVFNEEQQPAASYYIPTIGWESLAIRLYFRGDIPDLFVPVYPIDRDASADVKIWEIHYPPDIQTNPKYLRTGIPEIDAQLQLQ